MLEEIGRRPCSSESGSGVGAQEREGYALAAGLALGLITLGRGRQALGLSDLRIEERLRCLLTVWLELVDGRISPIEPL